MKNILFIGSLFCLLLVSCTTTTEKETSTTTTPQLEQFGAAITADNALPFRSLLTQMKDVDSLSTKVVGTVESVCQKKGCWVNIVDEESEQSMFVKFKDYAFFLPKDIAGRQVVLEGVAFREVTSVEELRHYAEDEGKSAEVIAAITTPAEELKFMASGAVLLPQ
ncbi:MAG: DUF4920 domain-containing protein [Bacteroidota bacterium]